MKVPFADLKGQYLSIKMEIDATIAGVIDASAYIGGPYMELFIKNFASYTGAKHCIGVGNGTDALQIALKVLGIGRGEEVITAANSFIATSEAISLTGATPVFVDNNANNYTIDVTQIRRAITIHTRAIIPVHLYGCPADMDEILSIAKESSLFVVEDCAQAHGARYRDRKVGTMGVFGCFSFFPGKNLGAYGDAGALITNDDQLALKAKMYANHGRIGKYDHEFEGTNSRLDGLQAAILDVKLKHLDTWTARRRAIAELYDQGLKAPVITPRTDARNYSVYHLYVVRVPNREQVQKLLAEKGITTGIHYPIPLPFLKAYSHFKATPADFPVCHTQKDAILSLPVFDSMTNEQAGYIIDTLNGIAAKL